jgi:hypothetical protein
MTKKLPDHFWDYRNEVQGQYPALEKADKEHDVVKDKLREVESQIEHKTQYSNTHDAALGILNELRLDFECGGELNKKEKKFAHKYFGMWDAEESIYENLEESLEVLRQAKRNSFRKIIELEDQLPKLKKDEERLRKLWRMESDKVEAIYDDLKKEEKAEEERARQQKIQDDSESNDTEEKAA